MATTTWTYDGERWRSDIAGWQVGVVYEPNVRLWVATASGYGEALTTLQANRLEAALIEAERWASDLWDDKIGDWEWDNAKNGYVLFRNGRRLCVYRGHGSTLWWLEIPVGYGTKHVTTGQRDPRDAVRWIESWVDVIIDVVS